MLTNIARALWRTEEKLDDLLIDFATNYPRESLAVCGLVEIENHHIRRNSVVETGVGPTANEKADRSIPYRETTPSDGRPELIWVYTASDPTEEVGSIRRTTPNCRVWTAPEVVAALSVAGAAIVGLLLCLAPIFKS